MKNFINKKLTVSEALDGAGKHIKRCKGSVNTFWTISYHQYQIDDYDCDDLNDLCKRKNLQGICMSRPNSSSGTKSSATMHLMSSHVQVV